jgi:cytochrome c oxidase subunit 2
LAFLFGLPRYIFTAFAVLENLSFVLGIAVSAQKGFQPAYSPVMEGIIDLHHYICFFLTLILVFVTWVLGYTLSRYGMPATRVVYYRERCFDHTRRYWNFPRFRHQVVAPLMTFLFYVNAQIPFSVTKKFSHWTNLEIAWTVLPSLVLLSIACPSFVLLYSTDELTDDIAVTIKVIGHQWYWSYEYVDLTFESAIRSNLGEPSVWNFDSYLVPWDGPVAQDAIASTRLLGVDNPLYLPTKTHVRFLVSAADVLHSFAVPSLGLKTDAVPGRLNQTFTYITTPGIYFGQCSEICGVNHGFMPVQVVALPWELWSSLLNEKFVQ